MKKTGIPRKAANFLVTGAVAVLCVGCPHEHSQGHRGTISGHHPHNLHHFNCPDRNVDDYTIEVTTDPQVLKHPEDAVVFACEGDKISWSTQDASLTFKIKFKDSYANDLFGTDHFESDHGHTGKGKVKPQDGHEPRLYKYSIDILKGDVVVRTLDPHIMPTGK